MEEMAGTDGDQMDSGGAQTGPFMGSEGVGLGGGAGAAPLPPVFGNAAAQYGSPGEHDFKGINLDDVFSGVFFSPEGDLLDIPSDEDESLNLTLSSTSISEGSGNPPFAQFAVLGDGTSSIAGGGGGEGGAGKRGSVGQFEDVFMVPPAGKHEGENDEAGAGGLRGGVQGGDNGQVTPAAAPAAAGAAADGGAAAAEGPADPAAAAEAAAAAAAAAMAAAEARAAQETALSKAAAAVKAAAAHAQAQARVQVGGGTAADQNPPPGASASPPAAAPVPLKALPTGGITAAYGARGDASAQVASGGSGVRGISVVAPPGYQGSRARGGGFSAVGAPRRQRHKVSSKDLTEEQRIERRERNREHAKRSRVRKKFLLDSLQRSVDALQAENDSLKGSIVGSLGERGRELVAKCAPEDTMGTLVTANPNQATKILDDPDYSLVKALQTAQQNFVITDASLPDNPIVFASGGFLQLTRYKLSEVLGRNCRFLQGPETDPRAVDKIRTAIEEGYDTSVCLLNYRADGTTFWNQFFVASLRDGEGNTVNYVGVQCKVSDDYARIVVSAQNKQLASAMQQPVLPRRQAPVGGTAVAGSPATAPGNAATAASGAAAAAAAAAAGAGGGGGGGGAGT